MIWLNYTPVYVRYNLFMALKVLHERDHMKAKIWIDALCINQHDVLEQGHQVMIIGEISSLTRGPRVDMNR